MRMLSRVEGMPLASLEQGLDWGWQSTADYFDRVDGRVAPNIAFFVGHSTLRRCVLGEAATERAATPDEITAMAALLREGLAAGGLGFSSSLAEAHSDADGNPVPSRHATPEELLTLAAVCREFPGTALGAGAAHQWFLLPRAGGRAHDRALGAHRSPVAVEHPARGRGECRRGRGQAHHRPPGRGPGRGSHRPHPARARGHPPELRERLRARHDPGVGAADDRPGRRTPSPARRPRAARRARPAGGTTRAPREPRRLESLRDPGVLHRRHPPVRGPRRRRPGARAGARSLRRAGRHRARRRPAHELRAAGRPRHRGRLGGAGPRLCATRTC